MTALERSSAGAAVPADDGHTAGIQVLIIQPTNNAVKKCLEHGFGHAMGDGVGRGRGSWMCVAHFARSVLAESLLDRRGRTRFRGYSAGSFRRSEDTPWMVACRIGVLALRVAAALLFRARQRGPRNS